MHRHMAEHLQAVPSVLPLLPPCSTQLLSRPRQEWDAEMRRSSKKLDATLDRILTATNCEDCNLSRHCLSGRFGVSLSMRSHRAFT